MRHVLLAATAACLATACTEGSLRAAPSEPMAQAREGVAGTSATGKGTAATGASATPSPTAQGTGGTDTAPPATAQGAGSSSSATEQGAGGTDTAPPATAQGAGSSSSATAQGAGGAGTTPPTAAQGAGSAAQGSGGTAAAGPCSRDETFRITTVGKGKQPAVQVEPDPGYGKALRAAEVDLDGRGQQDLYIIFPTDAGSDGATMQALYVHCSGDRYAPVWGPEYTLELKPLDTRTQGWRDVVHREKSGTFDAPTVKRVTMRFQGDMYQDASTETEKP